MNTYSTSPNLPASGRESLKELVANLFEAFAKKELVTGREQRERFPFTDYPIDIIDKALDLGMFDLLLSEENGGAALPVAEFCEVLSMLSQTDAGMANILFTHATATRLLEQAERPDLLTLLKDAGSSTRKPLLAFQSAIDAFATVPGVTTEYEEEKCLLSGKAKSVYLGHLSTHAIIAAHARATNEISFYYINMCDPTVRVSAPSPALGLRMCPAVDVDLSEAEGILIANGEGDKSLYARLADEMMLAAAAMSLGVMKGSLREATEYSRLRQQGGRPIADWSEVKSILGDMTVATLTSEMALKQACREAEARLPFWQASVRSVAVHIQKNACSVTSDGIQVLGGYGFMEDYGQEKRFRDAAQLQSLFGMSKLRQMECAESFSADLLRVG